MLKNLFRSHTLLATAVSERNWMDISDFEMDVTILNPHALPPNKFETLNHYYRISSCDQYIKGIRIPTLFLNALDDPIVHVAALAVDEIYANPYCILVTTSKGGHLGWWQNSKSIDPRQAESWATYAIVQYVQEILKSRIMTSKKQ